MYFILYFVSVNIYFSKNKISKMGMISLKCQCCDFFLLLKTFDFEFSNRYFSCGLFSWTFLWIVVQKVPFLYLFFWECKSSQVFFIFIEIYTLCQSSFTEKHGKIAESNMETQLWRPFRFFCKADLKENSVNIYLNSAQCWFSSDQQQCEVHQIEASSVHL